MPESVRNIFFRKDGRRSSVPARRQHDSPLAVNDNPSLSLLESPMTGYSTSIVAQRRRSAYVPTHAASDFSSMPVATSYRESQAYSWRHGIPAEYPRPWFQFEDIKPETEGDKSSEGGFSRPETPDTPSTTISFTSPWGSSRRASAVSTESQNLGAAKRRSLGQKVSEYFRPPAARGHTRNNESVSAQSITFPMDE